MPKVNKVEMVDISTIRVVEGFNPRSRATPSGQLLVTIREHGILNPIKVRDAWKGEEPFLYVVGGERRFKAAVGAGLKEVPVERLGVVTPDQALVSALLDNVERAPMSNQDCLRAITRLREMGKSIDFISTVLKVGKRKVVDVITVEERGSARLKKAAATPVKAGGVLPRVAAEVAKMSHRQQKEVLPKVKGKSEKEGMDEVKKVKKVMSLKKVARTKSKKAPKEEGHYRADYPWAEDASERCQDLERLSRDKLQSNPQNATYLAYMEVVSLMKGGTTINVLFPEAEG